MTNTRCPSCGTAMAAQQINAAQGVAFCEGCGTLSRLEDVMLHAESDRLVDQVPQGCSIAEHGPAVHLRASLHSTGAALGMLAVTLFWNGIVSVFVLLALAALWANLVGPLPDPLPEPKMNDEPMTLGMTILLCLFLIPFVTIGMGMMGMFLLLLRGRIDVRIEEEIATIRTGIGLVGWTRRFDPRKVTRVSIDQSSWQSNGQHKPVIRIDADKMIKFGSMLPEARLKWLQAALHVLLVMPASDQRRRMFEKAR